jgi:hypothetical protein
MNYNYDINESKRINMKKYVKVAFGAVVAAVAGYNVYQSQSVINGMSEFALANVEALADDSEASEPGCKLHLTSICETSNGDHYLYRNR